MVTAGSDKSQQKWIYLSPHLDDVVLSCGGIISKQVSDGIGVEIWTIFAGDPPDDELTPFARSLHTRWEMVSHAASARRLEDINACASLGVKAVHFPFPDCIYRKLPGTDIPVIKGNDDLFKFPPESEMYLAGHIQAALQEILPAETRLVLPLSVGSHMDHHITRLAGERILLPACYYAEFPYVTQGDSTFLDNLDTQLAEIKYEVDKESLFKWQNAVARYQSQISTFWKDVPAMYSAILEYWQAGGGSKLFCDNTS